ncbi:MAG: hypothetical protein NZ518_06350 [Dehalococcoidia bacterium]|nr:hypothetical protein [Dehalococcoidia bacterium]
MEPITRVGVVILAAVTAVMHFWLITVMGSLNAVNFPFLLNGVGYLALAALFVVDAPVARPLAQRKHLLLGLYTIVTILAWVAVGERSAFAYVNKVVEVALLGLIVAHWRQTRARGNAPR